MAERIKQQTLDLACYSGVDPPIKVRLTITDSQIWIAALNDEGQDAGTVMLENYQGKIFARVWREQDEGNDPYQSIIVKEVI